MPLTLLNGRVAEGAEQARQTEFCVIYYISCAFICSEYLLVSIISQTVAHSLRLLDEVIMVNQKPETFYWEWLRAIIYTEYIMIN